MESYGNPDGKADKISKGAILSASFMNASIVKKWNIMSSLSLIKKSFLQELDDMITVADDNKKKKKEREEEKTKNQRTEERKNGENGRTIQDTKLNAENRPTVDGAKQETEVDFEDPSSINLNIYSEGSWYVLIKSIIDSLSRVTRTSASSRLCRLETPMMSNKINVVFDIRNLGTIFKNSDHVISKLDINGTDFISKSLVSEKETKTTDEIINQNKRKMIFAEEIILHETLWKLYEERVSSRKYGSMANIFPKLNYVFREGSNEKGNTKPTMVEKMRMDNLFCVFDFIPHNSLDIFENSETQEIDVWDMIIQLANAIDILQNACNFCHRDFHFGNVMYIKHDEPRVIHVPQFDLTYQTRYEWKIIDLEYAICDVQVPNVNQGMTKLLETLDIRQFRWFSESGPYENHTINLPLNRSHDLRLLISSLYYNNQKSSSPLMDNFAKWADVRLSKYKEFVQQNQDDPKYYYFYEDEILRDDEDFRPFSVLKAACKFYFALDQRLSLNRVLNTHMVIR